MMSYSLAVAQRIFRRKQLLGKAPHVLATRPLVSKTRANVRQLASTEMTGWAKDAKYAGSKAPELFSLEGHCDHCGNACPRKRLCKRPAASRTCIPNTSNEFISVVGLVPLPRTAEDRSSKFCPRRRLNETQTPRRACTNRKAIRPTRSSIRLQKRCQRIAGPRTEFESWTKIPKT